MREEGNTESLSGTVDEKISEGEIKEDGVLNLWKDETCFYKSRRSPFQSIN